MSNKPTYEELEQRIKKLEQKEKALEESKSFFNQMLEQSIVSTQLLDPEGNTIRVNPKFCELFGVTSEDMNYYKIFEDEAIKQSENYEPLLDVFNNKNSHRWRNSFDIALASESSGVETTKPEMVHLVTLSYPILDMDENLKYVVIQHYNITDQVKAEHALKESEERFRGIVENSKGIIFVINAEGHFIISEGKALSGLGLKPGQVVGLDAFEVYKEYPEVTSALQRVLKGETVHDPNLIIQGIQDKRHYDIFYTPNLIGGETVGIIGEAIDITEHKQAEEALEKAHNDLEIKVKERTADFKIAKEESDRANKLKSEFLSNMSHELRTPMHAILSFSKFGIDKIDKTSKKNNLDYFKKIKIAGNRLMDLLNNLLDLSKLEAGKEVYKMESIDICQVVNAAVSEMETSWKEKKLRVKVENPLISEIVVCDENKIAQVISNLLSNAIKFTPEDKQVIISFNSGKLPLGQRSSDKEMISALTVSVKDGGIGVPKDELDSVFDKFIQSSTTKTGAGGTGLGLAICKEIIRAHNGKIWAENDPEGGATFSFMLPYEQEVK